MNILVFPGGTEIGLEIFRCLAFIKNIKLFSVASNVSNHSSYIYLNHKIIPDIYTKNCVDELNKVLKKNKIDLIYPANDLIIDFLIENKKEIISDIIVPDEDIVILSRSKKATYEYFKNKIPVPTVFDTTDDINAYPVFVKPDKGYGSQGATKIHDHSQLEKYVKQIKNPVVLEYLPGNEYTIDCFSSKKNGLLFCSGRERTRVRMGTSMNGILVNDKQNKIFWTYGKVIHESLGMTGAWFFQMKEDKNDNTR